MYIYFYNYRSTKYKEISPTKLAVCSIDDENIWSMPSSPFIMLLVLNELLLNHLPKYILEIILDITINLLFVGDESRFVILLMDIIEEVLFQMPDQQKKDICFRLIKHIQQANELSTKLCNQKEIYQHMQHCIMDILVFGDNINALDDIDVIIFLINHDCCCCGWYKINTFVNYENTEFWLNKVNYYAYELQKRISYLYKIDLNLEIMPPSLSTTKIHQELKVALDIIYKIKSILDNYESSTTNTENYNNLIQSFDKYNLKNKYVTK